MNDYKKLAYLAIVFGTLGFMLFLSVKTRIVDLVYLKDLGKILIAIGIYLLAAAIISIPEPQDRDK